MVKSETRRRRRNPCLNIRARDSISEPNQKKTSLRDSVETLLRFRDRAKIFRDPRFSGYHLPPLRFVPDLLLTSCDWSRLLLQTCQFPLHGFEPGRDIVHSDFDSHEASAVEKYRQGGNDCPRTWQVPRLFLEGHFRTWPLVWWRLVNLDDRDDYWLSEQRAGLGSSVG